VRVKGCMVRALDVKSWCIDGEVNQVATQPVCKAFTSDPGGHEAHANAFAFEYCPGGHFKQGCVGV
jgi:hypothetical protein